MKRCTALVVPGGHEVARLIFRKLEAEQRRTLPECLQRNVEEFLGWYYSSYNFQKAIDAATSRLGKGKLFLLRNLTLTPLNCVCEDCNVYGVLRQGSLVVESLGGPWEVRLHRGGTFSGDERAFILTGEGVSSLTFRNFSIQDSLGGEVSICMRLFFRPASEPGGLAPGTTLEQISCRSMRESRATAALTCFNRLGRALSAGDRLIARKGLCLDSKIIRAGCTGVVREVFSHVLECLFSVEWSGEDGTTFLVFHRNRFFLELAETHLPPPSRGGVSNGCIVSREGRMEGAQNGADATPLPRVQTPSTVREPHSHARDELNGLATELSR